MPRMNILHVEHDNAYADALEDHLTHDEKLNFIVYRAKEPGDISNLLRDLRFDLILADVFWPETKTGEETIPRLKEIIDIVRERDSLVPIVVLSEQPSSFKEAIKYGGEIYDIWSKISGYSDFHIYRVKNVAEVKQNTLSENVLFEFIVSLNGNGIGCWKIHELLNFFKKYRVSRESGYMLYRIVKLFKELGYHCGLSPNFTNDVFGEFAEYEPIDLSRSPEAWGHLRHSLSVFLVGYGLLNSSFFSEEKNLIMDSLKMPTWDEVNKAWFLTAALHDSTIFLEHLPRILVKINSFASGRLNRSIKATARHYVNNRNFNIDLTSVEDCKLVYRPEDVTTVERILECVGKASMAPQFREYMKIRPDHGILSAINLYNVLPSDDDLMSIVISNACYAMMIHNCLKELGVKINQDSDFLAQLLCFVDRFQAWGRENQYEGLLDGNVFEHIVLREFDFIEPKLMDGKKILRMKIDHLPFRYISPTDTFLMAKEEKLIEVLRDHFETLSNIGLKKINDKRIWKNAVIEFTFCILGRVLSV